MNIVTNAVVSSAINIKTGSILLQFVRIGKFGQTSPLII